MASLSSLRYLDVIDMNTCYCARANGILAANCALSMYDAQVLAIV